MILQLWLQLRTHTAHTHTAFTSNNDNDEIRSLLPIRTLEQLEEINERITDDSGFEAKLVGSCISYLFPWGLSLIT